jgi:hypothetical protein
MSNHLDREVLNEAVQSKSLPLPPLMLFHLCTLMIRNKIHKLLIILIVLNDPNVLPNGIILD